MTKKRRVLWRVLLLAVVSALALVAVVAEPAGAPAATVKTAAFGAAADSYVRESKSTTNYGTRTTMQARGSPIDRAYLRFAVGGLEGTVSRATLRVYATNTSSIGFSVHSVADTSWGERTITYRNAPAFSSVATVASGPLPTSGWVTLDVTSLVAGNGAVGFALTSTGASAVSLATRDGSSSRAPSLDVETNVPDTPPGNTSPPTISGSPTEGDALSAHAGSWSGTQPITFEYRWHRCDGSGGDCAVVPDATAAVYSLSAEDVGSTLRVEVTASNVAGTASANSAPTAVVERATPPVNASPPTIGGTAAETMDLSATTGTWSGTQPMTFAYQWTRCDATGTACEAIGGATAHRYTVAAVDVGATLRVEVTAANAAGSTTATSAPTAVVTPAPESVVVAAAGDLCGSPTDCAPTASLLDAISPDRVLPLGDLAYDDGTLSEFNAFYDPNWGRHKAKTSPTPGNHEYFTSGASGYFTYFGSRVPAPYYSYDLGSWHVISLNSEINHAAGSVQETWLRNDLAATTKKCILAYAHKPRFSSGGTHGSHASLDAVWRVLHAAGADVMLGAHEHSYERFAPQSPSGTADPNGIRQFVVGTGGHEIGYGFGTPLATSEVRNNTTAGVLELTLRADGYLWRFVPAAGGSFTDSGSGTCQGSSDTVPPSAPTNLTAAVSSADVRLAWTAASDDTGVTRYDVFRDGAQVGSTTTTSFFDTSFAPAATYTYTVRARDAAGNISQPSNSVTVTTAAATVVTLAPVADARVDAANPATNFGSSSTLRTQGGSDPAVETNLMFDVPALNGNVRVATLRLYASSGTVSGPSVYGSATGWSEGGITWNARPTRTSGVLDARGVVATGTWVEWDVTAAVTSAGTYSFTLASTSSDGVDFRSRDASSNRPQLVLTLE